MKLKVVSQIVIVAGFVLFIGAGVMGLMYIGAREAYSIDYESGSSTNINYSVILEPNHDYEIVVSFSDTAGEYDIARVEGTVIVFIDGIEVDRGRIIETGSSDDDYGSVSEAFYYEFTPATAVNLTVGGELVNGDEWSISIYQDVPAYLDDMLLYVGVLFMIGAVVLLVGGGIHVKAKRAK